jgi:hypothetical protein
LAKDLALPITERTFNEQRDFLTDI